MTHPVVLRRIAEQEQRIERAARWARALAERVALDAVIVFGSTARGDFNKWSDVDVLVISEELPTDPRLRLEFLTADAPPGLQPVGWNSAEFARRRERRDPIARECETVGHVVYGVLRPRPSEAGA